MEENNQFRDETMISDIRDNSLTGMMNNKSGDRITIVTTIFGVVAFIFLIFIYPIFTRLLNINNFIGKTLLFIVLLIPSYYWTLDVFALQRRKRDKKMMMLISKGGDMINYFMKVKDFRNKDYNLPYHITVVEGVTYQMVPVEVTYYDYDHYARLLDSIGNLGINHQEFELKGKITLFDKYRAKYSKFEGTILIKFLESIYRENEKIHKDSTSRRFYMALYIPYSSDLENVLSTFITGSYCKMQFLNEKMFKEMVEQYFCAPVNLERLKTTNTIRNITLDETKLIDKFDTQEELEEFLLVYKTVNIKNTFKYQIRKGK